MLHPGAENFSSSSTRHLAEHLLLASLLNIPLPCKDGQGSFWGCYFQYKCFENCKARNTKRNLWGKFLKDCDPGSGNLAHQYWWVFPQTRPSTGDAHCPVYVQIFVTSHHSDAINTHNLWKLQIMNISEEFLTQYLWKVYQYLAQTWALEVKMCRYM